MSSADNVTSVLAWPPLDCDCPTVFKAVSVAAGELWSTPMGIPGVLLSTAK